MDERPDPDDLIEGSGTVGPSKYFSPDPFGYRRGQDFSYGLMQDPPKIDFKQFMKNYTTLASVIRECGEDSEAWFPDIIHDLMYTAGCIAGEAGELVNEVKKVRRGTHTLDDQKAKIEEESVDVLIFLACLWYELGTDVTEVYNAKRARNVERFGSGRVGTVGTDPGSE